MRYTALMVVLIIMAGAPAQAAEPAKDDALGQAFERLKALAGLWEIASANADIPKGAVTYRVTGGGSAVIETLFAGTEMEMVSLYHRDGKDLVMTHYCCAGNQPRFKARLDDKTGDLIFDFAGGSNLDSSKDMHIHGGRVRFTDKDTLSSEWIYYVDGKKGGAHTLTLNRKK